MRPARAGDAAVHCRVEPAELHAHLFRVSITVARPQAVQRMALPAWIPGSYLVREFAKNLQNLAARQGRRTLELQQLDKCSWQVACDPDLPLELRYAVYARDDSVRAAWLDAERGFFNGTSLFLQLQGFADMPHVLELVGGAQRAAWQVATGLAPLAVDRRGWGRYRAGDYDELVDCPVEMGAFWSGRFVAGGVRHRMVVAGAAPGFDGKRLLEDTRRICETAIRLWHGKARGSAGKTPHRDYLFMLNAVDDAYGGLEHRNSTALIAARKDLPRIVPAGSGTRQPEGYTTLLGLISHEYFHTWNIKRLRPSEFAQFDYGRENYTRLLWFFEGFTSYYDDLLVRRAGLIDDATYLRLLTKTINQVLQTPGRQVQSVAEASFDAWIKYYRQDENTPNATVSYYTKGACVALCVDLRLRALGGGATLDDLMRGLWRRCAGGPMREQDLLDELQALTGRSWQREIAAWVHGRKDLPLRELLAGQGVAVLEEPSQPAQALGLRVAEQGGIQVRVVLRGGLAEQAGFAAGDEWLAVEVGRGRAARCWRLQRLDDLALYTGAARAVVALVARDRRVLRLDLRLPRGQSTWRLAVRDAKQVAHWLEAPDAPAPRRG